MYIAGRHYRLIKWPPAQTAFFGVYITCQRLGGWSLVPQWEKNKKQNGNILATVNQEAGEGHPSTNIWAWSRAWHRWHLLHLLGCSWAWLLPKFSLCRVPASMCSNLHCLYVVTLRNLGGQEGSTSDRWLNPRVGFLSFQLSKIACKSFQRNTLSRP